MNPNKVFIVIDANSVIHRAFHAMPALTNKKGQQMGALHGFISALFRAVNDFRPDYIAACFDTKAPTFRHLEFKDYKAQRPATAVELVPQLETAQKLLKDLGVAVFVHDGFEADDLIASVIKTARSQPNGNNIDFYVLTGDYDSLQLVDSRVKAFIINRGIKNAVLYDNTKVKEIFGVAPDQIPALKALAGDSSDNIPGAPGIGKKGAAEILGRCGDLEKALAAAKTGREDSCLGRAGRAKKMAKILAENDRMIQGFKKLAMMRGDAPVGAVLAKCAFDDFSGNAPRDALLGLGLVSLARRLPQAQVSRNGTLF